MTGAPVSHDAEPGSAAATPDASSLDAGVGPGSSSSTTAAAASANGSHNNKRKRGAAAPPGTSTSSRGVANLTPEQLERKRANDREAQRAIRERTKQQIERLNDRIRELESSQPYRELQAVVAQKEAVQAENDEIKRQLASFMSVFQRYLSGSHGLEELAAAAEHNALPYQQQHGDQTQLLAQQDTYPSSVAPDHGSPHGAPSVGSPMSQTSMPRSFQYNNSTSANHHNHNHHAGRSPWGMATPNSAFDRQHNHPHHPSNIHPDLAAAYGGNDERLGVDFLLENNENQARVSGGATNSTTNNGTKTLNGISPSPGATPGTTRSGSGPADHHQHNHTNHAQHSSSPGHWNMIPKRVPATCPLDAILLDAVAERHRARASGAIPREDVAGPTYPNWNHLLNKHTSTPVHPISKLITDILRTFPDLDRLPEQVAVIYIMFLVARWEADPTRENYDLLPEWIRPLPSQLFTPHPCWLDYLPWPRLRDAAVQTTPIPNFDTFFVPYTTTLRLNWPYAPTDVLLLTPSIGPPHPLTTAATVASAAASSPGSASSPGAGGQDPAVPEPLWRINPAFETHLRDLGNWSLGPLFRDTYPSWGLCVRIKEDDEGVGGGGRRGR